MLIAHSAKVEKEVAVQPYEDHVNEGIKNLNDILHEVERFLPAEDYQYLSGLVKKVFTYHDLGKLCPHSQAVLWGRYPKYFKMPNHVDAGTAALIGTDRLAAWIIQAHHWGYDHLPGYQCINKLRDDSKIAMRCPHLKLSPQMPMWEYTDKILPELLKMHHELVPVDYANVPIRKKESGLFMRMALSMQASADHLDTGKHFKDITSEPFIALRPQERLEALDTYVSGLSAKNNHELKNLVYRSCRNSDHNGMVYCQSEVGTGKTTAVMAYALNQAAIHGKRRIFYIAPFTNGITQQYNIYKNALACGDNDLFISEDHHQIDLDDKIRFSNKALGELLTNMFLGDEAQAFEDDERSVLLNRYTHNWHAPIICTTAVQFFETLAGVKVGKLKKLHNVIGSVIIIDESHNCIPSYLWPLVLPWLRELVDRFGCTVVFASGSMIKPWDSYVVKNAIDKVLGETKYDIKSIVPDEVSQLTCKNENARIPGGIEYIKPEFDLYGIVKYLESYKGSKIVVCNTIHNAAILANTLKNKGVRVEHLSTALTPVDRESTIKEVKNLLDTNCNWTLVATSCVESSMDFSFQWGFRENSSLLSVQQLAGRVNRDKKYTDSKVVVFNLKQGLFNANPDFEVSRMVFEEFYADGKIGPEFCIASFEEELIRLGIQHGKKQLLANEKKLALKEVSVNARVIDDDKFTVIVYEDSCQKIKDIARNSVQIFSSRFDNEKWVGLFRKSAKFEKFFVWNGKYDRFLGYYAQFISLYHERK